MRNKTDRSGFTLIELIAAMGVFSIIMLVLLSFFSSAQNIWNLSRQKTTMYENARIALDLISRDLQCMYYEQGKVPFYHHPGTAANYDSSPGNNDNDTEALYFISATNCLPGYDNNTRLCEIAYKFYNIDLPVAPAVPTTSRAGWLVRSVTGDQQGTNTKWNYYGKPEESPPNGKIYHASDSSYAFTNDESSRDVFSTVIPYVVDLKFICLKRDGTTMIETRDANGIMDPVDPPNTETIKKMIPYSIMIELTLLDRESWMKWAATSYDKTSPILLNNKRTFSRTVLIGERGQKY